MESTKAGGTSYMAKRPANQDSMHDEDGLEEL